jgi:hypothetical protein
MHELYIPVSILLERNECKLCSRTFRRNRYYSQIITNEEKLCFMRLHSLQDYERDKFNCNFKYEERVVY